jgi:hypothetical protein
LDFIKKGVKPEISTFERADAEFNHQQTHVYENVNISGLTPPDVCLDTSGWIRRVIRRAEIARITTDDIE